MRMCCACLSQIVVVWVCYPIVGTCWYGCASGRGVAFWATAHAVGMDHSAIVTVYAQLYVFGSSVDWLFFQWLSY
jgi:hypothetical protein